MEYGALNLCFLYFAIEFFMCCSTAAALSAQGKSGSRRREVNGDSIGGVTVA